MLHVKRAVGPYTKSPVIRKKSRILIPELELSFYEHLHREKSITTVKRAVLHVKRAVWHVQRAPLYVQIAIYSYLNRSSHSTSITTEKRASPQ